MLRTVIAAALAIACVVLSTSGAEARRLHARTYAAHPDCNRVFPCEGVVTSARGEKVVKAMGGFGAARKVYKPRNGSRNGSGASVAPARAVRVAAAIQPHPAGCPSRAFCGCGAAVRLFGAPVRSLWLAAAWFKFPRAEPAPGMVAVRRHHVFVLESHLGGSTWLAYDANSGGHATRLHARSIAGWTIVNPRAGRGGAIELAWRA
jgi:hypothetical protein